MSMDTSFLLLTMVFPIASMLGSLFVFRMKAHVI